MKKKNGAHTHVRTTVQLDEHNIHVGCCLFSHHQPTNDTNNHYGSIKAVIMKDCLRRKFCKEKKNGAHTNSCTTVQFSERNIHVGCCLFSHNRHPT